MQMTNPIGILADGAVGNQAVLYLLENYPEDVKWIVLKDKDSAINLSLQAINTNGISVFINEQLRDEQVLLQLKASNVNYIFLAWWPFIIKDPVINLPNKGVLNFHPSMLPYNRGKHYNFWTLIENSPFGVSIHFVDKTIDGGDILFQQSIDKDWTDTGETLYNKAQKAMIDMFREKYPQIRRGEYVRQKQDLSKGSFHLAKEIDEASRIVLDQNYTARDLLNILRARTFVPHQAAWFEDNGEKYEVRINIKKI